jgi:hypothetical protein
MIAQPLYQPLYRPQAFSLEKNDDIDINELSLYLDFALDKTLTARKGPTPTFSRGTSATRVNEAGLIQYAPENLFLNSGGASRTSAFATKYASNELDPDGGSSCLMVVETNISSQARTELPSSFADAYTRRRVFSWWVKPSPGVTLPAYLHLVYKDNARVSFSTATWSVATQTEGATGSIVESNGWYKLIAYLPGETPSSTTHKLVFTNTDYYGSPITAIRGLLVGSCQLSSGTFAWPHFQTLTNPYYAPRFDHDPVTLACKGLLIEESRQNSLLNSDNLSTQSVTVTAAARTLSFYGTGTVVLSGVHTATVVGTGAYPARTTLTFTPTAGTLTLTVTGTVQFAQLEAGSFPTSYIPTTTTALTRSADVCSVTTAGWANAGDDTIVIGYFVRQGISGAMITEGSPSVSWQSISFTGVGGVFNRCIYRHGGAASRLDASSNAAYSLTELNKIALTSGEQICLNGSLAKTVQADPLQGDISTSLSIGSRGNGASLFLNGHIARIQYFKKRLPNAKLQSLTT